MIGVPAAVNVPLAAGARPAPLDPGPPTPASPSAPPPTTAAPPLPPVEVPAIPVPPPVGATVGGAEAVVRIASVGIDLAVVAGGQSVIDRGLVAHYVAAGWEPPVAAGSPGTYWLAGHHETHGAPFADLPLVAVGDEIVVTTGTSAFAYTVTSTAVTDLWPGDEAVYGTDPSAATILLQTCIGERRFLVRGVLRG